MMSIDEIRDEADCRFVEQTVTYVLEHEGQVLIVEQVPARVCVETGERLFTPETVERLQEIAWKKDAPSQMVETPVYKFVA